MDCHPSARRDGYEARPNDVPDGSTVIKVVAGGCCVGRFNGRYREGSDADESNIEKYESKEHGRSETLNQSLRTAFEEVCQR